MRDFIHGIPKAELHLHIEGTLEPELKFALAERNGVDMPYATVEDMKSAYDYNDLTSFLAMYYEGMTVLLGEQDFYDLAMAYLTKAASQNVVYAEISFDPQAHTSRAVPFETVLDGLRRAQADAAESLGLRSELIMCFLRDLPPESAMETLETALPHKDKILGVGLDSDERDNPPSKFGDVFARARQEGFRIPCHCDVDQQNSVQHIWQAVRDIEVERLDHSVNCLEDPELVEEIKRRDLTLTVCPISNSWVTDGFKEAEIKQLVDSGVRVTINSDDPAYFPGYVEENLVAIQEAAGLSQDEVVSLVRNGFEAAWLPDADKKEYLAAVDGYVG